MTFQATAIEIMLASPNDVKEERVTARRVIAQWNAEHSRESHIVLLTMGWETHSGSDVSGQRAQAQINQRLVAHADLMIGIFWTKLGSPTGRSPSGTVEEIKLQHKLCKPLMLFFSDAPVSMSAVDEDQMRKLKELKRWAFTRGIVSTFSTRNDFQEIFRRDLNLMLKDNERMKALAVSTLSEPTDQSLPPQALELLKRVGSTARGQIIMHKDATGIRFSDGVDVLISAEDAVEILKWRAALEDLLSRGLLVDRTGRNQLFELTPKASTILRP